MGSTDQQNGRTSYEQFTNRSVLESTSNIIRYVAHSILFCRREVKLWTLVLLGLWYYCLGDWIYNVWSHLEYEPEPTILMLNISEPFPPPPCPHQKLCSPRTLDYLEELIQEFVSSPSKRAFDEVYLSVNNEYFVAIWNEGSVVHLSAQDKRHNVRWYFGKRWTKKQIRTVPRKSLEDEIYRIKFSLKHISEALKTLPRESEHQ